MAAPRNPLVKTLIYLLCLFLDNDIAILSLRFFFDTIFARVEASKNISPVDRPKLGVVNRK